MEGLAAAVVVIAILLGVLLVAAFDVFCLARLAARDDRGLLRKLAWAAAIVCISPIGGLVYLFSSARLTPYAPRLGDGRPPRLPARPGRPGQPRPGRVSFPAARPGRGSSQGASRAG